MHEISLTAAGVVPARCASIDGMASGAGGR